MVAFNFNEELCKCHYLRDIYYSYCDHPDAIVPTGHSEWCEHPSDITYREDDQLVPEVSLESGDSDSDSYGEKIFESSDSGFHTDDSHWNSKPDSKSKKNQLGNTSHYVSNNPQQMLRVPLNAPHMTCPSNPMRNIASTSHKTTHHPISTLPQARAHSSSETRNMDVPLNSLVSSSIGLKRKASIDKVSSSDPNNMIKPDSSEPHTIKQKRFNNTAKSLRDSGLLPIAIKTGNLMKKNLLLQQEIQNLKHETALFLKHFELPCAQSQ